MAKRQSQSGANVNGPEKKATGNHYQEVLVKVTKGKDGKPTYEKIKVVRPVVKISEEEANILNEGILHGGNTYASMYFKPEGAEDAGNDQDNE